MRIALIIFLIVISSLISAVVSIFTYQWYTGNYKTGVEGESYSHSRTGNTNDTSTAKKDITELTNAAEIATPAVVHITTLHNTNSNPYRRPYEGMFKDFFGGSFHGEHEAQQPLQGFGSGVIVSEDGFIVTNNHVIADASKIQVVLNDKRSYTGKLVGADPHTDLALIKIQENGLPFLIFGNSESLSIGSWVLAVGNPFNLNSTVTAGIISAQGRSINVLRNEDNMAIESFIQTDAVVNPGNSGGALVNLQGELIGINTAIASPTGAFTGYAFAVPETIVKKIVEDFRKYGFVQRAFLGVAIMDINAEVAKVKGIENIVGVYIASVNKGGAAEKSGMREGDIITDINGKKVNSAARLQEVMAMYRPGEKIKLTFIRRGKLKSTDALLQNREGQTKLIEPDKGRW
jgi:Do/DeqQ family serine protease